MPIELPSAESPDKGANNTSNLSNKVLSSQRGGSSKRRRRNNDGGINRTVTEDVRKSNMSGGADTIRRDLSVTPLDDDMD